MMITKGVILLCIFFFDSIDVDGKKHHQEQVLNVKISFLCSDEGSQRFFGDQLFPALDDLTDCINLEIYPLYVPEPPRYLYDPQVDLVYQCAYDRYKGYPYTLGIYYKCVMETGEFWEGCRQCAYQILANINVDPLMSCIVSKFHRDPDTAKTQLTVELNGVTSPEALTGFKNAVCNKLKEINKPCACCSPP